MHKQPYYKHEEILAMIYIYDLPNKKNNFELWDFFLTPVCMGLQISKC